MTTFEIPSVTDKPKYGSPCNGCGLCCIAEQCPISLMAFGEQLLCPALGTMGDGKGFGCGLIVATSQFIPPTGDERLDALLPGAIAYVLGAGRGCDSEGPDDTVTDADREKLREGIRDDIGHACMQVIYRAVGVK